MIFAMSSEGSGEKGENVEWVCAEEDFDASSRLLDRGELVRPVAPSAEGGVVEYAMEGGSARLATSDVPGILGKHDTKKTRRLSSTGIQASRCGATPAALLDLVSSISFMST
jgi:hypothetical protein